MIPVGTACIMCINFEPGTHTCKAIPADPRFDYLLGIWVRIGNKQCRDANDGNCKKYEERQYDEEPKNDTKRNETH
jgi:hypothetical protein